VFALTASDGTPHDTELCALARNRAREEAERQAKRAAMRCEWCRRPAARAPRWAHGCGPRELPPDVERCQPQSFFEDYETLSAVHTIKRATELEPNTLEGGDLMRLPLYCGKHQSSLQMVSFLNQPPGKGHSVPDALISARFAYYFEVKTARNAVSANQLMPSSRSSSACCEAAGCASRYPTAARIGASAHRCAGIFVIASAGC
jgi:hypothetical protein